MWYLMLNFLIFSQAGFHDENIATSITSVKSSYYFKLDFNNACRYYLDVIKSLKCKETECIFSGAGSRGFPQVFGDSPASHAEA